MRKKVIRASLVVAFVGIAAAGYLMFGPPNLLVKSSQPQFCVGCHVMEAEYAAWIHAGAHRSNRCVDCHLPNQNMAVHYLWKSIDGLKDAILFYSGQVSDDIELTDHGREVLQANCIRCHEQTVSMIDQNRHCWACHRQIQHSRSGTILTR